MIGFLISYINMQTCNKHHLLCNSGKMKADVSKFIWQRVPDCLSIPNPYYP